MNQKESIGGVVGLIIFAFGYSYIGNYKAESDYIKRVVPQVNIMLDQLSLADANKFTLQQYKEMHLASCNLANKIRISNPSIGEKIFSDDECIKLMFKLRPLAKQLQDKEEGRAPASN